MFNYTIEKYFNFYVIGIARMNMGIYEGAIGYFEQQLATLEQLSSHTSLIDKVYIFIIFMVLFIINYL